MTVRLPLLSLADRRATIVSYPTTATRGPVRIDGVPYRKDRAARVAFHHPWRSSSFAMDVGVQGATMAVAGVLALDGCTLRSAGM